MAGIIFRRYSESSNSNFAFPESTPKVLNSFIIYISLPALILYHIHELKFQSHLIALIIMPWIIFVIAIFYFRILGKLKKWDNATIGALTLTAGLGNTSFVGLPMIEAYYGKEYLGYGLLADQAGSFFMLSTLGILVASKYSFEQSEENLNFIKIMKKIFTFPPFFVLVITFFLKAFEYPEGLKQILKTLGNTLTPLAIFSVGFQLKLKEIQGKFNMLYMGLLYKLILAPIIIAFLYSYWDLEKSVYHISIFEAAMAPMITAGIVAISYNLNPALVSLMLAVGIPFSFLTLPIFWYFFH